MFVIATDPPPPTYDAATGKWAEKKPMDNSSTEKSFEQENTTTPGPTGINGRRLVNRSMDLFFAALNWMAFMCIYSSIFSQTNIGFFFLVLSFCGCAHSVACLIVDKCNVKDLDFLRDRVIHGLFAVEYCGGSIWLLRSKHSDLKMFSVVGFTCAFLYAYEFALWLINRKRKNEAPE